MPQKGPHSAKRRHRSCPFRKAPSPTLSVTCFLSTPGSQACHRGLPITPLCHAAGSRASACLFPLWVWTQSSYIPPWVRKLLSSSSRKLPGSSSTHSFITPSEEQQPLQQNNLTMTCSKLSSAHPLPGHYFLEASGLRQSSSTDALQTQPPEGLTLVGTLTAA